MNWQEIIKPGNVAAEAHTQYTQNTQMPTRETSFEYYEDIVYEVSPMQNSFEGVVCLEDTVSTSTSNQLPALPDIADVPQPETRSAESNSGQLPLIHSFDWISDHIGELTSAGFTSDDLFRTSLPIGIAHCHVWSRPFLKVGLKGDTIIFRWTNPAGARITQTCRPEGHIGNKIQNLQKTHDDSTNGHKEVIDLI